MQIVFEKPFPRTSETFELSCRGSVSQWNRCRLNARQGIEKILYWVVRAFWDEAFEVPSAALSWKKVVQNDEEPIWLM
jgi:hypothetical protein